MAHQLDIMAVEHIARVKQDRLSQLSFLPALILGLLGHAGLLPPNSPKHISDIISRSIRSKSIGFLSSLHRNGCSIDFKQLSPSLQSAVLAEINSNSYLTRALRAVISNIQK